MGNHGKWSEAEEEKRKSLDEKHSAPSLQLRTPLIVNMKEGNQILLDTWKTGSVSASPSSHTHTHYSIVL